VIKLVQVTVKEVHVIKQLDSAILALVDSGDLLVQIALLDVLQEQIVIQLLEIVLLDVKLDSMDLNVI